MSNVPEGLKYTKDHEWVRVEGTIATVGITDYAQHELGDIVFVDLPEIDDETTKEEQFGEIEAVKTVAPLNSPVSGKIVEVNESLADSADVINSDPYGDGWIIKVELSDPSEIDSLVNSSEYEGLL